MVVVAILLGYGAGASANLILLGWLPWAVDAAMVISMLNHHLSDGIQERRGVEEKLGVGR